MAFKNQAMSSSIGHPLREGRATRLARAFVGNRAGSVAVEFSMIGLACFGLIIETMQAGMYFYTSAELNNATARAMRQVMTGAVTQQGLTATQFRTNVLCPYLPSVMPCSSVVVNMQSVNEDVSPNGFYKFVNAAQTAVVMPAMDNNKTSFCSGGSGTVIYAQVYYAMPVFSMAWKLYGTSTFGGSTVHLVPAAAVFRNEPFQATQSSTC